MSNVYKKFTGFLLLINAAALALLFPGVVVDSGAVGAVVFAVYLSANLRDFVIDLYGNFIHGYPNDPDLDKYIWPEDSFIHVVFASKGDNVATLERCIKRADYILKTKSCNYEIEVVTDDKLSISPLTKFNNIIVPENYTTPNNSLFKTRALHFAATNRKDHKGKNQWILHMDEETLMSESSLAGIIEFINDEKNPDIGQGEIIYNTNFMQNIPTTILDLLRVAEDLGIRRLVGMKNKIPYLKGSFLIIKKSVEEEIGFDFGPEGSLAEDAFFAEAAKKSGKIFVWVDGYMNEQSPHTIAEAYRQRLRWFSGLMPLKNMFDNIALSIFFRYIFPIILIVVLIISTYAVANVTAWSLGFGSINVFGIYMLVHGISAISLLSLGAIRTVSVTTEVLLKQKILLALGIVVIGPLVRLLDLTSAVHAMIKPVKTFYVLDKD